VETAITGRRAQQGAISTRKHIATTAIIPRGNRMRLSAKSDPSAITGKRPAFAPTGVIVAAFELSRFPYVGSGTPS
jgi:hypothetical protein